jgi:hypothetical protein
MIGFGSLSIVSRYLLLVLLAELRQAHRSFDVQLALGLDDRAYAVLEAPPSIQRRHVARTSFDRSDLVHCPSSHAICCSCCPQNLAKIILHSTTRRTARPSTKPFNSTRMVSHLTNRIWFIVYRLTLFVARRISPSSSFIRRTVDQNGLQ